MFYECCIILQWKIHHCNSGAARDRVEERRGPIQFRRCWSQHYTAAMFLTWFGSEAGPLCLPVLHMFLHTDSLSTFLPLSLCHLAALRWTLPVTTVLQIAELWFLHMQIMQCFHTNIDRAKLVDSQSVFVFSLGGLDSSQFLLIEIDKISDVEHQLFSW